MKLSNHELKQKTMNRATKLEHKGISGIQAKQLEHYLAQTALGDQEAFKHLYELCGARLNGVAYRILNNADSANEVLQEAFVQIWRNAKDYRSTKAEPLTWMSSIVRYRALDRIRSENRRTEGYKVDLELAEFDSLEDNSSQNLFCDADQQLEACLQKLEHSQQKSILLAYYYGFSRDEISQQLSSPVNTVKSWLRRGLMRLQLCLEK